MVGYVDINKRAGATRLALYLLITILLAACAATPPQPQTPPSCSVTQLRAHAGPAEAGMGHITRRIYLQNVSRDVCRLAPGLPQLQLLATASKPLQTLQQHFPYPGAASVSSQSIFLRPGEEVGFLLHYATQMGYGNASCPWASALSLRLSGLEAPLHLAMRLRPYGGLLPHPSCGEIGVTPLQKTDFPPAQN